MKPIYIKETAQKTIAMLNKQIIEGRNGFVLAEQKIINKHSMFTLVQVFLVG